MCSERRKQSKNVGKGVKMLCQITQMCIYATIKCSPMETMEDIKCCGGWLRLVGHTRLETVDCSHQPTETMHVHRELRRLRIMCTTIRRSGALQRKKSEFTMEAGGRVQASL